MYVEDGDGAIDYTLANGDQDLWMRKLMAYQGAVNKLRFCAITPYVDDSDYQTPNPNGGGTAEYAWKYAWTEGTMTTNYYGSYTLNGWFYKMGATSGPGYFAKDTAVQFPSQTPLFMDGIWADCWPTASDYGASDLYTGDYNSGNMGRICIVRHGSMSPGQAPRFTRNPKLQHGGIDMAYSDGHSAYVPLANLWQQYWSVSYVAP